LTDFQKNIQISYFINIGPVRAELFRVEGQKGGHMKKLIVTFLQFC